MKQEEAFNEREYLALLLHHPELISSSSIKYNYFGIKQHQYFFKGLVESYAELGTIEIRKIEEKSEIDLDIKYFIEVYANTLVYETDIERHKRIYEESIINSYKDRVLIELNNQLIKKEIDNKSYMKKLSLLNEIKVGNEEEDILEISNIDMSQDEVVERVKSQTTLLDQFIKGFGLGQLSVWSGGNASAKSTYLNQIAIESIEQGYNVAIYSGELMPKRLLNWIITQCAGIENMLRNNEKDYWYVKSDAKEKILNWLNGKLFIYNNAKGNGVTEIINAIKYTIQKKKVKVIILDNLMSMNLNAYGDSKYDVQSILIQNLSNLAKEMNVHIHFVCHPRKAIGFLRKTDISGTADLTNIADNVFILHRTNNDFKIKTKEMFGWRDDYDIYKFSNVIEVCKNRDFGVEDVFVGMYYQKESRRLLNEQTEKRTYTWNM